MNGSYEGPRRETFPEPTRVHQEAYTGPPGAREQYDAAEARGRTVLHLLTKPFQNQDRSILTDVEAVLDGKCQRNVKISSEYTNGVMDSNVRLLVGKLNQGKLSVAEFMGLAMRDAQKNDNFAALKTAQALGSRLLQCYAPTPGEDWKYLLRHEPQRTVRTRLGETLLLWSQAAECRFGQPEQKAMPGLIEKFKGYARNYDLHKQLGTYLTGTAESLEQKLASPEPATADEVESGEEDAPDEADVIDVEFEVQPTTQESSGPGASPEPELRENDSASANDTQQGEPGWQKQPGPETWWQAEAERRARAAAGPEAASRTPHAEQGPQARPPQPEAPRQTAGEPPRRPQASTTASPEERRVRQHFADSYSTLQGIRDTPEFDIRYSQMDRLIAQGSRVDINQSLEACRNEQIATEQLDGWMTDRLKPYFNRRLFSGDRTEDDRVQKYLSNISNEVTHAQRVQGFDIDGVINEKIAGFNARRHLLGFTKGLLAPIVPRWQHEFFAKRHAIAGRLVELGQKQQDEGATHLGYQLEQMNLQGMNRFAPLEAKTRVGWGKDIKKMTWLGSKMARLFERAPQNQQEPPPYSWANGQPHGQASPPPSQNPDDLLKTIQRKRYEQSARQKRSPRRSASRV